jgi:ferrous iron transport protein B
MPSCHVDTGRNKESGKGFIRVALAGNANVGKSVLFNQLTGSHQIIGNWPGKTVDIAVGNLFFEGYKIQLIDLPGIYSFSTYSEEEVISREYIATESPDIVINVVDASVLERNLYFTLQLLEMDVPLIICLNQVDMARKKGIDVDVKALEKVLGVPVVPTVAIKGEGIYELMRKVVELYGEADRRHPVIRYDEEIERRIGILVDMIRERGIDLGYSPRFLAIKLLEGDVEIKRQIWSLDKDVARKAEALAYEIIELYDAPSYAVISSQRYKVISDIVSRVVRQVEVEKSPGDWLDILTTHRILGYVTSAGVLALLLLWTFIVGDMLSSLLENIINIFHPVEPVVTGPLWEVLLNGAIGGIVAGITLVIPYVVPFYLYLSVMEDSGIMTRVAFMIDSLMHKIGLHGKAIIPLILGYGCNVPAIYSTRIMETRRERILTAFAITLVPCSARTIVILGLVSRFLGFEWALLVYLVDILVIFTVGKMLTKIYPGESTGLIMEIHSFRVPSIKVVLRQTFYRTRSIIYLVFPLYIVGSALVQGLYSMGVLSPINSILSPITSGLMGLPDVTGILLVFGFIRKELILLLLPSVYGSLNILLFMSPLQIFVLSLVTVLYIPCISTLAILAKEFGWRDTIYISLGNLITALFVGGLTYHLISILTGII